MFLQDLLGWYSCWSQKGDEAAEMQSEQLHDDSRDDQETAGNTGYTLSAAAALRVLNSENREDDFLLIKLS